MCKDYCFNGKGKEDGTCMTCSSAQPVPQPDGSVDITCPKAQSEQKT